MRLKSLRMRSHSLSVGSESLGMRRMWTRTTTRSQMWVKLVMCFCMMLMTMGFRMSFSSQMILIWPCFTTTWYQLQMDSPYQRLWFRIWSFWGGRWLGFSLCAGRLILTMCLISRLQLLGPNQGTARCKDLLLLLELVKVITLWRTWRWPGRL